MECATDGRTCYRKINVLLWEYMTVLLVTHNHSTECSVPSGSPQGEGDISCHYHRPIDLPFPSGNNSQDNMLPTRTDGRTQFNQNRPTTTWLCGGSSDNTPMQPMIPMLQSHMRCLWLKLKVTLCTNGWMLQTAQLWKVTVSTTFVLNLKLLAFKMGWIMKNNNNYIKYSRSLIGHDWHKRFKKIGGLLIVLHQNLYKTTTTYCCVSRQVVCHNSHNKHDFIKTVGGKRLNSCYVIKTLRPWQNGQHLADDS